MSKTIGTLSLYDNKYADNSYKYVRRFTSSNDRDTFYDEQPKYIQEQCSYLMENDTVLVDLNYETARKYNYARFKNSDIEDSEYMYYFITNVVYKAPGISILQLTLDHVTSYLFGNYEYEIEGNIASKTLNKNDYSVIKTVNDEPINAYRLTHKEEILDPISPDGYGVVITSGKFIDDNTQLQETTEQDGVDSSYYTYLLPMKELQVEIPANVTGSYTPSNQAMDPNFFDIKSTEHRVAFLDTSIYPFWGSEAHKTFNLAELKLGVFMLNVEDLKKLSYKPVNTLKLRIGGTVHNVTKLTRLLETTTGQHADTYTSSMFAPLSIFVNNNALKYGTGLIPTSDPIVYLKNKLDGTGDTMDIFRLNETTQYFKLETANKTYYLKQLPYTYNAEVAPFILTSDDYMTNINVTANLTAIQPKTQTKQYSLNPGFSVAPFVAGLYMNTVVQSKFEIQTFSFLPDMMNTPSNWNNATKTLTLQRDTIPSITVSNLDFSLEYSYSNGEQTINRSIITFNDFINMTSGHRDRILNMYYLPLSNEMINSKFINNKLSESEYFNFVESDTAPNADYILNVKKRSDPYTFYRNTNFSPNKIGEYPYSYAIAKYGDLDKIIKKQYTPEYSTIGIQFKYDFNPNPSAGIIITNEKALNNNIEYHTDITSNFIRFPVSVDSETLYNQYYGAMNSLELGKSLYDNNISIESLKVAQKQQLLGAVLGATAGATMGGQKGNQMGAAVSAAGGVAGAIIGVAAGAAPALVNYGLQQEQNELKLESFKNNDTYLSNKLILNENIERMKPATQLVSGGNTQMLISKTNKLALYQFEVYDDTKQRLNEKWNRYGYTIDRYSNLNKEYFIKSIRNHDKFDFISYNTANVYNIPRGTYALKLILENGVTFIDKNVETLSELEKNNIMPMFEITNLPEKFEFDHEYTFTITENFESGLTYYIEDYDEHIEGFAFISFIGNQMKLELNSYDPSDNLLIIVKCLEYPNEEFRFRTRTS